MPSSDAAADRDLTDEDIRPGGSAYSMVWGRGQDRSITDRLAEAWGVKVFVGGHQPATAATRRSTWPSRTSWTT
jgi:hypothetical protein